MVGGIGQSLPYPSGYLESILQAALVALAGAFPALAIVLLTIGFFMASSGWRLAVGLGARSTAYPVGAAIFATFNPWVYNEVVAGHFYLVFAVACFTLLASELLKPHPRPWVLAMLVFLSVVQIQIFLLCYAAAAISAVHRKEARLALASGVVAALPMIFGVFADRIALGAIPYHLAWQIAQSVDPKAALVLQGYSVNYAARLGALASVSVWAIVILSALGCAFVLRSPGWRVLPIATLSLWLFATGAKGPTAVPYDYIVQHVRASAVYRELYDVIGLLIPAYILLVGFALVRFRALQPMWLIATATMASSWAFASPGALWVSWRSLPQVRIDAPPNTRFALVPAFQPLTFHGRGSGIDPNAYVHPNNVTPANEPDFQYPSDVAFARFIQTGDTRDLAALSVSRVVEEPWLKSDTDALKYQVIGTLTSGALKRHSTSILDFVPELTLGPLPPVTPIANRLGYGQVFFGDVAGIRGVDVPAPWLRYPKVEPVAAPSSQLDAATAWIDARLAFVSRPDLGQSFGGAFTTSPRAVLRVTGGENLLVYVRGELLSVDPNTEKPIVRSRGGYIWVALPDYVRGVRCAGECVVAAKGQVPRLSRAPSKPTPYRGVTFRLPLPWVLSATVPPTTRASMLRYNVRFNPGWIAVTAAGVLPHFRVDGTMNAWVFARAQKSVQVIILNYFALAEFLLQGIALCWFGVMLLKLLRKAGPIQAPTIPTRGTHDH